MEKNQQPKENGPDLDVTDEKYEGPSAHIAALGTGVVKHLKWAGIGLLSGGVGAWFFPTQARQVINGARTFASFLKRGTESSNAIVKASIKVQNGLGSVLHFMVGDTEMAETLAKAAETIERAGDPKAAEWLSKAAATKEHGFAAKAVKVLGVASDAIPGAGKKIRSKIEEASVGENKNLQFTSAVSVAGMFGFTGYVTGWLYALVAGAQHGNKGKHQFERAKKQIIHLQRDNEDLNAINDELHAKYVKAATRLDDIQASQENAARELAERSELPALKDAPAEALAAAAPKTDVQLDQKELHGKLAASPELAANVA